MMHNIQPKELTKEEFNDLQERVAKIKRSCMGDEEKLDAISGEIETAIWGCRIDEIIEENFDEILAAKSCADQTIGRMF